MSEIARKRDERGFGGAGDIQDAWRVLAGGAPHASRALVHIAKRGRSEAARVAASKTILEMVGFGGRDVIPVRVVPAEFDPTATGDDGRTPAAQIVRERMAQLAAPAYESDEPDIVVVDAEIVDTPSEYD